ncbi:MAG: hypothetical protein ABIG55_04095 [Candidatus Omnitrophota bacterium]|nr:hypothetical protein [Candidatus Omnitrophota bacterium]
MEEQKKEKDAVGSEKSLYGALSYVSIFCLVPIFMKKEDEFIRFHARQGLMLFLLEVGIWIVSVLPLFGGIIHTLGMLICGVVSLTAIVQVLMGKKWKIPVIGEWAENIKI